MHVFTKQISELPLFYWYFKRNKISNLKLSREKLENQKPSKYVIYKKVFSLFLFFPNKVSFYLIINEMRTQMRFLLTWILFILCLKEIEAKLVLLEDELKWLVFVDFRIFFDCFSFSFKVGIQLGLLYTFQPYLF